MKLWVLVGFFSLAAAPNAFASLDDPLERLPYVSLGADAVTARTEQSKQTQAKPPAARPRLESEAEAPRAQEQRETRDEEGDRRRQREDQRRRRSGSYERVPDAVLIGGRGAL